MTPVLDAETRHALRDKRFKRRLSIFLALMTCLILPGFFLGVCFLYAGIVTFDAYQTTVYAPDYNWREFRSVSVGDSVDSVLERIGEPIDVSYQPHRFRFEYDDLNLVVTFRSFWTIHEVYDPQGHLPYPLPQYTNAQKIEESLGEPTRIVNEGNTEWWWYSITTDPGRGNHWVNRLLIDLETKCVIEKKSYLYLD